jgi:hypothetical protein
MRFRGSQLGAHDNMVAKARIRISPTHVAEGVTINSPAFSEAWQEMLEPDPYIYTTCNQVCRHTLE